MYKFSVVIPIYNVEKYLRKCLDSIINQTLKDIEIICINDGSTDNSLSILTEYAQKDTRIKILNQENQGPGVARNNGIAFASGEYLLFVDSDDWIELNTLEILYNNFKKTNTQLIQFNYYSCKKNKKKKFSYKKYLKKLTNINLKENFVYKKKIENLNTITLAVWDKAYSLNFIKNNNIKFSTTKTAEDIIFTIKSFLSSNKRLYLKEAFYNYLERQGSSVNSVSSNFNDIFINIELLKNLLETDLLFNCSDQKYRNFILKRLVDHYCCISYEDKDKYLQKCKKILSKETYKNFIQLLETRQQTLLEKIFSLTNKKINGIKYKVIKILGFEFVFKPKSRSKVNDIE